MKAASAQNESPATSTNSKGTADGSMASCPMHAQHTTAHGDHQHGAEVDARHDTLGMNHEKANHSFRLFSDGGAIELRANATTDRATVDAIRTHIRQITTAFSKADFSTPAFVHGDRPSGAAQMERLKDSLQYRYEEIPGGARVRVTVTSPEALAAIHDFLQFQVVEHRTSDSGHV
ncbi:MAG: hypothetical protein ABI837_17215, partial [Acidobacteriota bacterium]